MLSAVGCGDDSGSDAGGTFTPKHAGVLTVITSLPAPGFWDGPDVDHLTGGFEWGIANDLAKRFGLEVKFVNVPFEQLAAGDFDDADIALAQISTTDARRDLMDFSSPYYPSNAGALATKDVELKDLAAAKDLKWVVEESTTEQSLLDDVIKPDDAPLVTQTRDETLAALADGRADAALLDLPTALATAHEHPELTVPAQFMTQRADGGRAAQGVRQHRGGEQRDPCARHRRHPRRPVRQVPPAGAGGGPRPRARDRHAYGGLMDLLSFHTPDRAILSFFAVLVVIAVGPWLAERLRLPGLLGLLFGGLLIGPYVLGIVQESDTFIKSLGEIGLLYLMYLAGLDLDLEILRRYKRIAITFAIITFVWPMALGFMTGELLGYKTAAAILLGSIWASHTLLTYPTFRRYGLANQRAVAVTVGATVITDTLALVVLALVSGYTTGDASGVELFIQIMLGLLILAAFCFLALPRIVRWLMPSLGQPPTVRYIIALAALFSAVVVCEMFGIDGIVGAFFAGLALNPLIPKSGPLFEHIEFFGSALFIPMFLVSVGLIIEPSVMVDPKTLGTAAVFALSCIGGKLIAAMLCKPVFKYSWIEVGAVFALSVNQAAATLAATFVGYEIGLFGTTVVNAVLIVIVISVILGSVSAARYAPRLPVPPIDTSRLGRRVMVVVGDGQRDDAGSRSPRQMSARGWRRPTAAISCRCWCSSRGKARSTTRGSRRSTSRSPAVGSTPKSSSVSTGRASMRSRARQWDKARRFAVVPAEPPGLDTAVFGAQEDRLVAQMPIPMVLAMLKRTPTRFVLALSERDQRRASRNVQVVFEVAARLAKAGHPVSVYSASPLSPEQLSHLGGAEAVYGDDDRAAFLEANIDEHTAVIVPAPGGTSVFGHDIPSLAELGAGLLIAVGSEDDEADTVTIGHNLAAGGQRELRARAELSASGARRSACARLGRSAACRARLPRGELRSDRRGAADRASRTTGAPSCPTDPCRSPCCRDGRCGPSR